MLSHVQLLQNLMVLMQIDRTFRIVVVSVKPRTSADWPSSRCVAAAAQCTDFYLGTAAITVSHCVESVKSVGLNGGNRTAGNSTTAIPPCQVGAFVLLQIAGSAKCSSTPYDRKEFRAGHCALTTVRALGLLQVPRGHGVMLVGCVGPVPPTMQGQPRWQQGGS